MKDSPRPDLETSRNRADEPRCLDLLVTALQANRGVTSAAWDRGTNELTLTFRPDQISHEAIRRISSRLDGDFGTRYRRCRVDPDRQPCDVCSQKSLDALPPSETFEYDIRLDALSVARRTAADTDAVHTSRVESVPPPPILSRGRGLWTEHHLLFWTLLAGISITLAWLLHSAGQERLSHWLYLLGYVAGGWLAAKESFDGLRARRLDVNFLMTLAAVGAAILGRWAEGGTLIFLFSLSNTLEHYALEKTKSAVRSLMDLRPAEARVLREDGPVRVSVDTLKVGDLVQILPGEKIPADGTISEGQTSIDRSTFTGESLPVEHVPGETVLAGTLNLTGQITVRVNKRTGDTALAAIIHRVEQAQSGRTPTHGFVQWFGQRYTIGVLGGAALVALLPPLFFEAAWELSLYRSLTLLVVASPCALIISTPAAVLSALGRAAVRGVLFKGGNHLVALGQVRAVAFDKTGTLTQGRAVVTDITPMNGAGEGDVIAMAAAVESASTHPLAGAVIEEAKRRTMSVPPVHHATTLVGLGVSGQVDCLDGGSSRRIVVGNRRFLQRNGITVDSAADGAMQKYEEEGKTAVLVASENVIGVLAIADPPRPQAAGVITDLHAAGIDSVSVLTGDHERVAHAMALRLGIDQVRAELLPEEKADAVDDLMATYQAVAVVGDGVNDAPALASATVGIAMGGAGNDVVLDSADVVLMSDDLSRLPFAIRLARRTNRIIAQNLTFALIVIAALLVGTFYGRIPLTLGVIGHEGSTLLVVLNSLRLLWHK